MLHSAIASCDSTLTCSFLESPDFSCSAQITWPCCLTAIKAMIEVTLFFFLQPNPHILSKTDVLNKKMVGYKIFLLTIMFEQLMLKLWKFGIKKLITVKLSLWKDHEAVLFWIHKLCNPSMVVIWPCQITSCQIFNLLPFPTDEAPQFFRNWPFITLKTSTL